MYCAVKGGARMNIFYERDIKAEWIAKNRMVDKSKN